MLWGEGKLILPSNVKDYDPLSLSDIDRNLTSVIDLLECLACLRAWWQSSNGLFMRNLGLKSWFNPTLRFATYQKNVTNGWPRNELNFLCAHEIWSWHLRKSTEGLSPPHGTSRTCSSCMKFKKTSTRRFPLPPFNVCDQNPPDAFRSRSWDQRWIWT